MNFAPKIAAITTNFPTYVMPKKNKKEKVIIVYIPLDSSNQKSKSPKGQLLAHFQALIQAHYDDDQLKIKDFAEKMHLTENQLYRKIKALTNQSPITHLRLYRLGKALELLEHAPELTIAEIAYQVGFNDPNYFSRAFTATFGMTPREKRREFE